jgi:ADP-ribose pyrophosphatase YjhB (NUDIX family)
MINPSLISNSLSLSEIDEIALKFSSSRNWGMGAFIAVFDTSLEKVLLVKTGQYAKDGADGTPWNLPGGAVEPGELPSHAVIRELGEETDLSMPSNLYVAAWLTRPYFKSRHRETPGELIILFAGVDRTHAAGLRPAPPEIIACGFYQFDIDEWLRIPARGEGEHPLTPLPRHWIYWTLMAKIVLDNPGSPIFTHEYSNPASMAIIPDALKTRF